MKFSSTCNTGLRRCLYLLLRNQHPHFLLIHLFWRMLQPQVRINKMVNEHTVDYHPSPSEFTSRIDPLIFLWISKGFISPEFFLNFFSKLHTPPWLQKHFKLMVLRLLENTFVSQKICSFLLIPPSKTFPQVFIIKIYFSPAERGRTIELNIWPKLHLQGCWPQVLINATICNLYIFGLCFVVP